MWSRWLFNGLAAIALLALGWSAAFFVGEYRALQTRGKVLERLGRVAEADGPCAALSLAREISADPHTYSAVVMSLNGLRHRFAENVVGKEDGRGRGALISAYDDGLVDQRLCEQIRLSRELGEQHPVLSLLRYTRQGGDPCAEEDALTSALRGLDSHRHLMVYGVLQEVHRLGCISPRLARKLAAAAAEELFERPRAFDGLDRLRVGAFLTRWAPEYMARFGCWVEVQGLVSGLGNLVGCPPESKNRLLSRYRYGGSLQHEGGVSADPPGTHVLLLRASRNGELCDVMTHRDVPTLHSVRCSDLQLISDLHLAVHIDAVSYGAVRADLIAGLAFFDGGSGRVRRTSQSAPYKTWYAFSRDGLALGAVDTVSLEALAAQVHESVPANPLRSFCRLSGARHCYDVDWAELVRPLDGGPVVFLSRPEDSVILRPVPASASGQDALWSFAFPEGLNGEGVARAFRLADGRHLLTYQARDGVDIRWQSAAGEHQGWRRQRFGKGDGQGDVATARLLAVMDLQGDGHPELLVQRLSQHLVDGALRPVSNEMLLVSYNDSRALFEPLNRLTVHEY